MECGNNLKIKRAYSPAGTLRVGTTRAPVKFGHCLFPSPFDTKKPTDYSAIRRQLAAACQEPGTGHVTPHDLRSYFVTRARESGLNDVEITLVIGDKTGPAIIAHTCGAMRRDHPIKQACRIRLTATQPIITASEESSVKSSNAPLDGAVGFSASRQDARDAKPLYWRA